MKKKLLSFVFALLVMIPCAFLLTACGDDGNYMKIKIVDSHDAGVVGIRLEDGDELSSSSSHGYFTWNKDWDYCDSMVPKEKNYIVFIDLRPGYAMGSLTMYVNGEERSLRPLSSALQMIGNQNYIDFAYDDEANVMVDLWTVKADAVDEITITFKGRTELEKYDVKVSEINNISRTKIQNYQDLRFAFSINGEEKLKENATFDDFSNYFLDKGYWINDLVYGDQLIFKVWFDGGIVPFNNAELFSTYESIEGESWYTSCRKSYFDDATGKSVYIFDIYGGEKISMFWTPDNQTEQTINYNEVSLRLTLEGINNSDFTATESYTFEEIKNRFDNEQNVTFTIPNFKAINAKILQSKFVTLDISYNEITNSEKAQIISYDNTTNVLTLTFNKYTYQYYLGNLIFNDQGEDHDLANKPRLMSDYRDNPNEYLLRFYHDSENLYHNLITDGSWQGTPVVKLTHEYNGTEFNFDYGYEFEDQSHIQKVLWMEEDVQATVLNENIMVFYGDDLVKNGGITFEMSFNFFPAPTLDENGEYSSTGDPSRFEKITVTIGETKFDIRVAEGIDTNPETEEEFTYYYFVTDYDNLIDGLTVYDCADNDGNNNVHNGMVQFVLTDGFINAQKPHDTSIKFEYYLKNA